MTTSTLFTVQLASCGSAEVDQLTHDLKFQGLNPAITGTGREKVSEKVSLN
jgi:hypothetical protein